MNRTRTKAVVIAACVCFVLAAGIAFYAILRRPAAVRTSIEPATAPSILTPVPAEPRVMASPAPPQESPRPVEPVAAAPAPQSGEARTAGPAVPTPQVPGAAVKSLGAGNVSRPEVEEIYAFLESKGVPTGMTPMMLHALKNDLLNRLRDLPEPPSDLTQEIIRLYRDPSQDTVIRIYAVQHLGLWYDQITPHQRTLRVHGAGPAPETIRPPEEAAEIRKALRAALGERREGVAGTALLAQYYLLPAHPELDEKAIAKVALEMARDEDCDPLSRTSALQVCGGLGLRQARSLAVRLALQAPTVPLQTAAIAALGDLGGENERALLARLAEAGSPRLRPACESAVKRIDKRLLSRGETG